MDEGLGTALQYLSDRGQIICLLPAGCIKSEKDEEVWAALRSLADVEVLSWQGHKTFENCSPKTCIVRVTKSTYKARLATLKQSAEDIALRTASLRVTIYRGHRPMHCISSESVRGGIPLIHSTELKDNKINLNARIVSRRMVDIERPTLLIPRVGLPKISKMAVLKRDIRVCLSDCVIALCCPSNAAANGLLKGLTKDWGMLEDLYHGTGAPYVTIKRLAQYLASVGYEIALHPKGSRQLKAAIRLSHAEVVSESLERVS